MTDLEFENLERTAEILLNEMKVEDNILNKELETLYWQGLLNKKDSSP